LVAYCEIAVVILFQKVTYFLSESKGEKREAWEEEDDGKVKTKEHEG
jgi:hypothetical protein